jgi:hypothetical protein
MFFSGGDDNGNGLDPVPSNQPITNDANDQSPAKRRALHFAGAGDDDDNADEIMATPTSVIDLTNSQTTDLAVSGPNYGFESPLPAFTTADEGSDVVPDHERTN